MFVHGFFCPMTFSPGFHFRVLLLIAFSIFISASPFHFIFQWRRPRDTVQMYTQCLEGSVPALVKLCPNRDFLRPCELSSRDRDPELGAWIRNKSSFEGHEHTGLSSARCPE